MRDVAIIAFGQTRFGWRRDRSLRELASEVGTVALESAGIDQVDGLWVGNAAGGMANRQHNLAALLADELRLSPTAGGRIEAGGASGALAFRTAWREVAAGLCDTALVMGVEKLSDRLPGELEAIAAASLDATWEAAAGLTPYAAFALVAREFMSRYGVTREQLDAVVSKNRANAVHNELAAMRRAIGGDALRDSAATCDPLRGIDVAPFVDGAAAVLLAPVDHPLTRAAAGTVLVRACTYATDAFRLAERADLTDFAATRTAAQRAFEASALEIGDIHVAEVHDSFTVAELAALEALGLVESGTAGAATLEGRTAVEGNVPANTDGGLLARGDAPGANGIAQLIALVRQLNGAAGPVQVCDARIGLAHSMGGCDAPAVVTILEAQ